MLVGLCFSSFLDAKYALASCQLSEPGSHHKRGAQPDFGFQDILAGGLQSRGLQFSRIDGTVVLPAERQAHPIPI